MMTREAALRRYYRTIRSYLPCSYKLKNRILDEIQNSVNGYLEEHPDADFAEIEVRFGQPQNIAAAYVGDMDTVELLSALRMRRRIVTTAVAGVLTALVMWAACLGYAIVKYDNAYHGAMEIVIEEVSDIPNDIPQE